MIIFKNKKELKSLSKSQLIDFIVELQDKLLAEGKMIISTNGNSKSEPKKNSNNSSIPSSKDISKGKIKTSNPHKKGPKFGHKGISRKLALNPDVILYQNISECPRTGKKIISKSKSYQTHQILELIPGSIKIIEIRRQITTGPDGKTIIAPNPEGIDNNQFFGPYLKSKISIMRFKYHMEWDNIKDMLKVFYNDSIAQGSLNKIFKQLQKEFEEEYKNIGNEIKKSEILGMDETGARINGEKAWSWLFRNDFYTYFKVSKSRNHEIVNEVLGKRFDGIIVTDFWGAYNDTFLGTKAAQKCLEHLRRDLRFAIEINPEEKGFSNLLLQIIKDAILMKQELQFNSKAYLKGKEDIYSRVDKLILKENLCINKIENRLRKRIKKYRNRLFTFLEYKKVPYHNNDSERDIRKWVIFRKIYGCFRTKEAAEMLAVIFSVIDTCKKQNINVFEKIKSTYNYYQFAKLIENTS